MDIDLTMNINAVQSCNVQILQCEYSDVISPGGIENMYIYAPEGCVAIVQNIGIQFPAVAGASSGEQVAYIYGGTINFTSLADLHMAYNEQLVLSGFNTQELTSANPTDNMTFAEIIKGYAFDSIQGFRVKYGNSTNHATASGVQRQVVIEAVIVNDNSI